MRILHTSDWHIGKKLGRYDRMPEYAAVLDEVVAIADDEDVDAVVVSGDLFDRPIPPVEALRLGVDALVRLARGGERPVVAIAGNHDSADLFEVLAPLLAPQGVHLVGAILRPDEGGVREVVTRAGRLVAACFPFLREGRVVDFMADTGDWYGTYADRVRKLTEAYATAARERAGTDGVSLLVAHFLVGGVKVGGHGLPRGERALHMGDAYAATTAAIPPSMSYVALGHIHAPQPVPGAPVPAEYAGSLLELDFGEAGERKRVVIVDAEPGIPAVVHDRPVTAGRRLVRATGTWEEIVARGDLADAYVDLVVQTEGPDPGLADRAREAFPYLVKIRAEYPRPEAEERAGREGRSLDELFARYHAQAYGPPSDELLALFRDIAAEAAEAG